MNLSTIEITPEEAKERLAEYESVVRNERSAEDEAIAMGYRAAARGFAVIDLPDVMSAGGWFDDGLPRLAVVRADATECWVRVSEPWRVGARLPWALVFSDSQWAGARERGALVGAHHIRTTAAAPTKWSNKRWQAHTIVPSIPPRCRPRRPRLSCFHVLWEVETWDPTPPRDPALLRHIRGDLWAVVATWDLTDLERAVLAQRARS